MHAVHANTQCCLVRGFILNLWIYRAQNGLWMNPANNAASSVDLFLPVDAIQLNIIIMILLY